MRNSRTAKTEAAGCSAAQDRVSFAVKPGQQYLLTAADETLPHDQILGRVGCRAEVRAKRLIAGRKSQADRKSVV